LEFHSHGMRKPIVEGKDDGVPSVSTNPTRET